MSHDALAKLPIFNDMVDREIREALACAHPIEFGPGEKIITQGHKVRNLWFIRAGRCEVKRRTEGGCELKLAELGPDTQFGEMSFFHDAPHSADVISLTDMELLRLGRDDYDRLTAEGNPIAFKLAINSLEQLAERLRRTDQWITELVCEHGHKPTASEWTAFRTLIFRGQ